MNVVGIAPTWSAERMERRDQVTAAAQQVEERTRAERAAPPASPTEAAARVAPAPEGQGRLVDRRI
jgi:hypothetical protein